MSTLYIMCGVPGSGKTHFANNVLAKEKNTVVFSSDGIRKELYGDESIQGDNKKIFFLLYSRVEKALKQGSNVVLDATSVSRRSRAKILKRFDGLCTPIIVFMDTPLEIALVRNANRERKVPHEVITRMYSLLDVPSVEKEKCYGVLTVNHTQKKK